jgi:hypothetical protein
MSDARAERIDNAVASAGELIAALQDEGPVTPRQARVIIRRSSSSGAEF